MSALRLIPPMGAPIEIASDRTLIGRDPTADIVVNDPSVSRRHAIVERRPEGWAIFDQRSANGTWLDNHRVEQAMLASGQQLRLGAVVFQVAVGAPAPLPVTRTGPAYVPPLPAPPQAAPPAPAYVPPAPAHVPPAPAYAPPAPAYAPPAPRVPVNVTYPPQPGPPNPAPAAPVPVMARTPAYVPPAAPAAGAAPPRPPAGAGGGGGGGMTEAEAAEILGLWPGSPADEVRRRYQKLYNDFQVRLTNAPTPSLKKMYQKSIQDLRTACDVICPGALA
jgi:predicted component of type VI protein secretion system